MHEGSNNRKCAHTLLLSTVYEERYIKASHLLQKEKKKEKNIEKKGHKWRKKPSQGMAANMTQTSLYRCWHEHRSDFFFFPRSRLGLPPGFQSTLRGGEKTVATGRGESLPWGIFFSLAAAMKKKKKSLHHLQAVYRIVSFVLYNWRPFLCQEKRNWQRCVFITLEMPEQIRLDSKQLNGNTCSFWQ